MVDNLRASQVRPQQTFATGCSGTFDSILLATELGQITELQLPTQPSGPAHICTGPDGNPWMTATAANAIITCNVAGQVLQFNLPTPTATPGKIITGPDNNLWAVESGASQIARCTPDGTITEFATTTPSAEPNWLCSGPDNAIWFTEGTANNIGQCTTSGTITEFAVPGANGMVAICAGPDGNLWAINSATSQIIRCTTAGTITVFNTPTPAANPLGIIAAKDGNLWFTENSAGNVARCTPAGTITEFPIPGTGPAPQYIEDREDGTLLFGNTGTGTIGVITYAGEITVYPLPGAAPTPEYTTPAGPAGSWAPDRSNPLVTRLNRNNTTETYAITSGNIPQTEWTELRNLIPITQETTMLPITAASTELLNQGADNASVLSITPNAAGLYLISVYGTCTTSDPGANTLNINLEYTDAFGPNIPTLCIIDLKGTANEGSALITIYNQAGANILISATGGGPYGAAQYALAAAIVQVG